MTNETEGSSRARRVPETGRAPRDIFFTRCHEHAPRPPTCAATGHRKLPDGPRWGVSARGRAESWGRRLTHTDGQPPEETVTSQSEK